MKIFSKLSGNPNRIHKALLQRSAVPLLIIALALITGFLTTGCDKDSKQTNGGNKLSAPANVTINVTGRLMTVTWSAVNNALGYEIVTTSVGCSSGNRTINTREGTAVATSSGNTASNVAITGETSIRITLMAASGNPDAAMASAVTAKIMSLGGTVSEIVYANSDYSETVSKTIEK
ncbi:MAG: hypothetical protein LBH97_05255 [Treponema sp.]|jgi:hypothetical protein|nr:hypothetical protein [Treponema sp.]